jgi:elongation factor Ts
MTINLIKELREKTGAGIIDCRNALNESNNDFESAVQWLRKKGLAAAAKKSSRTAAQGLVAVHVSLDNKSAVSIEMNSETDFVALNEGFQNLVEQVSHHAINFDNVESCQDCKLPSGRSVKEEIVENIATIGENLLLRRLEKVEMHNGIIASYVHNVVKNKMGKIGVLVALESECKDLNALSDLGKKIAMHVAAAKPYYLTREDVPSEAIEKEKDVFVDQCKASGKPENIIANMIQGKINNFFKEVVLLDQIFVMDNKSSIADVIRTASKDLNSEIKLVKFIRFELGEGVEVEQSNFADDVKSMAQ